MITIYASENKMWSFREPQSTVKTVMWSHVIWIRNGRRAKSSLHHEAYGLIENMLLSLSSGGFPGLLQVQN